MIQAERDRSKGSEHPSRRFNWKNALPFGTHIRETISDIRMIRDSLKRRHKPEGSPDSVVRGR